MRAAVYQNSCERAYAKYDGIHAAVYFDFYLRLGLTDLISCLRNVVVCLALLFLLPVDAAYCFLHFAGRMCISRSGHLQHGIRLIYFIVVTCDDRPLHRYTRKIKLIFFFKFV